MLKSDFLTHRSSVITAQNTQMGRRRMISVAKLVPKAQTVRRENQPADPHLMVGLFYSLNAGSPS